MVTQTLSPIVVYGTGSIGFRHLQLLSRLDSTRALALPVRPSRRRELQGAGYATVDSLRQAWKDGARACVIATDTGRHRQDAEKALAAGFDLLVEKPLSVDASNAKQLLKAAKKARRKIYTACVLRFSGSLNHFRDSLAQLKKVHYVRIECQSYLPQWRPSRDYKNSYSARASEGGVLRDLIHEIDYAGWIFGWPDVLQARLSNQGRLKIQSEESADLLWTTKSGTTVSLHLDYLTRPTQRRMAAYGESGILEWDGVLNQVTHIPSAGRAARHQIKQDRDRMYADQLQEFQEAVFEKKTPAYLASGLDGFRALAVCDAARLSSKSQRVQKVRY